MTTSQQEFWNDIGPESDAGEMCGNLLPTPTARDHFPSPSQETLDRKAKRAKGKPSNLNEHVCDQNAKSILSPGVSPARLFQWRADASAWLTADGYGRSSPASFASFNPDGSLSKMSQGYCQQTMDGHFEEYCGTFPKQGTMRAGRLYRQPPLVRRISGKEFSLLPTPHGLSANQGQGGGEFDKAIRLLPSPGAVDANRKGCDFARVNGLRPNSGGNDLQTAVNLLATPQARDHKSGVTGNISNQNSLPLSEQIGGLLNPQFVEAIMGFPTGWTDLNASGTQ